MAGRHLASAWPSRDAAILTLLDDKSEVVVTYRSPAGSFRTIERYGVVYRHQGVDRATGERIYLPDVAPLPT